MIDSNNTEADTAPLSRTRDDQRARLTAVHSRARQPYTTPIADKGVCLRPQRWSAAAERKFLRLAVKVFRGHRRKMGTKSRESIYGASVRASAERGAEARKQDDRLACDAWNKRMLAFQGPAQPSPTIGDALNAGYLHLEVKCLGCQTHQTVALDIVRRWKTTPIHELERYMRCRHCSELQA